LSLCLTKYHAVKNERMKTNGGVDVLHAFLTSALDGGKWSVSHPGRFTPRRKAAGAQWVGFRAGLDAMAKRDAGEHTYYR